jgi:RNA polymerase sigma factor (sigma-70 family)
MTGIEPEQLGRLFDAHAAALTLYARSWCSRPEAEDAVQEAFAKLAAQRLIPDQPAAWLYRVVRNGAIAASRSFWRRRRREAVASRPETLFASTDDGIDARDASKLLDDLDPETRAIVVARIWGGLTFDEVAKLQGCSLTTAHRRYQDGLKRLHERLEPSWISPTAK